MRLPPLHRTAGLLVLAGALLAACSPAYVIVPDRPEGYAGRDTLHGRLKGKEIRVTFRHDTTWRVDTVTRWRTIYRNGTRVDTVVVVDTVRTGGGRRPYPRVDTVFVVVHDTVRIEPPRRPGTRVDTVRIVVRDTVRITEPRRPGGPGTPGGPIVMPPPPAERRVDTVRIVVHDTVRLGDPRSPGGPTRPNVMPPPILEPRVDTVRIIVRDTVRIVVHDTVRVGSDGRAQPRTTRIPPGQYPPAGMCRLWIVGTPPGQQARPARCDALGAIPVGAFILFADKAWDADYDWTKDPDAAHVPPEILAISRRRFH